MGLFEKKYCDVCGEKISLLGNRKVDDGNICSDCAKKLSPFFSERKRSTVADIKQQLAYREQNRQNLNAFNPTRTLGYGTKVMIDDAQRKFVVSRKSDFRAENADIIDIAQVNNVRFEIDEDRNERYTTDANGNRQSYNPPQFDYSYEIHMYITVNHPYFSEIDFDITEHSLDNRYTEEFHRYEQTANEIVMALSGNGMAGGMNVGYQAPMQNQGYQPYQQQQPPVAYQQAPYNQVPQNAGYQQPPQQNMGYQQPQQQNIGGYQQPPQQNAAYQQPPQVTPWFCQNCGMQNTGNAFCQGCGAPKQNG